MTKTIVWANHKGGVGKTTGAANTSAAHAEAGARVLAVDLDPQGHLGELFAVDQHPTRSRLEHVMRHQAPAHDAIVAVSSHLDVLPCSEELAEAQFDVAAANPQLQLLGIVLTQAKPTRWRLMQDTTAQFKADGLRELGRIPKQERVARALRHGRPILWLEPDGTVAQAYRDVARAIEH